MSARRAIAYLLFGAFFGFALSRVNASHYDLIYGLFSGTDLKLAWVMATAIIVGGAGMVVLRALGNRTITGEPVKVHEKPLYWGNVAGGAIFGLGWALSGTCPGTLLAQVGEGAVYGLFTLAGIVGGTYLYAWLAERWPAIDR